MLISTITTQRSGSKLLASGFNSGLETRSLGEIFNPDSWRYPGNFHQYVRAYGPSLWERSNDEILDEYFGSMKEVISKIIHFDVMYNQMEIPCLSWNPYGMPFILGYLKSRKSVILSLERDIRDSYVSSRYLEQVNQSAHVFSPEFKQVTVDGLELEVSEYGRHREEILRQRRFLREVLNDYPYFAIYDYSEIAQTGRLPESLCDLIELAAMENGIKINKDFLQLLVPNIYKSGIDYTKAFSNYHDLASVEK